MTGRWDIEESSGHGTLEKAGGDEAFFDADTSVKMVKTGT
jgi:hypothetical protein